MHRSRFSSAIIPYAIPTRKLRDCLKQNSSKKLIRKGSLCKILSYAISSRLSFLNTRGLRPRRARRMLAVSHSSVWPSAQRNRCRGSKTAHLKIPCTLLESDFLLAAQHSSKKDRRFNCFSGMCLCALELAPFFEVEIQLHTWHQICSLTTCGLLVRHLNPHGSNANREI
jgi:hypothetical protein